MVCQWLDDVVGSMEKIKELGAEERTNLEWYVELNYSNVLRKSNYDMEKVLVKVWNENYEDVMSLVRKS